MSPSKSSQVTLSYGAYKPVPPPKPLPSYSSAPSGIPQESRLIESIGGSHSGFSALHQEDKREMNRGSIGMPGAMPPLDHILVTDQGHFHTHSTKFPVATDTEKLLSTLRYSGRFTEGIENPALIHESPAMLYSTPQKNFERRPSHQDVSSPHYARMTAFETGEMLPSSYNFSHNHNSPDVHRAQRKLYPTGSSMVSASTNTIVTTSRPPQEHTRHVTFHPQAGYSDHSHMNGAMHHMNGTNLNDSTNGGYYIPQQLTNGTPGMRPNGHVDHYQTQIENRLNSECSEVPHNLQSQSPYRSKAGEMPKGTPQVLNHSSQNGDSSENKKEEKWGSLKLAGKKYSHLKNILSNKFSKSEAKQTEPVSGTPHSSFQNSTNSQGTNTSHPSTQSSKNTPQTRVEPPKFDGRQRGTQSGLNASFHKAVRYSSLQDTHQDPSRRLDELSPEVKYQAGNHLLASPTFMRNHLNFRREQGSVKERISMLEGHQPQSRFPNEIPFSRKSGSCGQLAQEHSWRGEVLHQQQSGFPWSHTSNENLSRALPSDHAYPEDSRGSSHLPNERGGRTSGGSDSGRGTGGSGAERESKSHDTSLESGSSTRNQIQHSQSSGNESEWIDIPEIELQKLSINGRGGRRKDDSSTPPLPLLSPESSPKMSSKAFSKSKRHSHSFSLSGANKPDLLETAEQTNLVHSVSSNSPAQKAQKGENSCMRDTLQRSTSLLPSSTQNWSSKNKSASNQENHKDRSTQKTQPSHHMIGHKMPSSIPYRLRGVDVEDELTSTDAALDLNSVLDGATEATSDDELTSIGGEPDTYLIRKQLEGLEGMYSEVLKLLGGKTKPHVRRRLHGSLSSLPSSITSVRMGGGRDRKTRVLDDRLRRVGKESSKSHHKRFQRLESHVVTLARSVAHLSSEMRTQHMMFQEIEGIKADLSAIKSSGVANHAPPQKVLQDMPSPWNLAKVGAVGLSNPGRVKKLTNFFGDEPPLVRLFLRKLGYEKYANVFEQEKIGMLELPYLTEERLQKIGIPLGPRIRILQEAQGPIKREGNLSVYVV